MVMVTAEVRMDTEVDTAVAIIAEDTEATGHIRLIPFSCCNKKLTLFFTLNIFVQSTLSPHNPFFEHWVWDRKALIHTVKMTL